MPGTLEFDFLDTRFGECLMARSAKGICFLDFVVGCREVSLARLESAFGGAPMREQPGAMSDLADAAFDFAEAGRLPVDLRGTDFQVAVWAALREIPVGTATTYAAVAARVGRPQAVRAVAGAIARNRIALLVPCHRVIRSDGSPGGFRWGVEPKTRLLSAERAIAPIPAPTAAAA